MAPQNYFTGMDDGLVDRLIEACQKKASPNAAYPTEGRDLVPWSDDGAAFYVASEPLEPARFSNNHHKHKHHHGSLPTTPVKKSGKAAAARRCSLEHRPAAGFACPSFAAAPKPEALPLPKSLLLSRRSPSPPKMQHAAAAAARA